MKKLICVLMTVVLFTTTLLSGCSKTDSISISELTGADIEPDFSFTNTFEIDTQKFKNLI